MQILDVDSGAEHQDFMLDKGMEYEYGQYIVCHSVVTIGPKTLQKVKCHHLRAGQDLHVDLQMCHSSIPSFKNLQTDRCSFHTSWQRVCNKRVGIL